MPDVVLAETAQQGASAEARARLRDHGPTETTKVSLSSDEETSAAEVVDKLMNAAPAHLKTLRRLVPFGRRSAAMRLANCQEEQ